MSSLKHVIVPIHKDGHKFIVIFGAVALLLALFSEGLGFVGLVLTCWCVYFFRDPPRVTPAREGLVISPADGIISQITTAVPPKELGMPETPLTRISVFLNVFDVHINRAPIGGVITKMHYYPGKFLNASLDKASEENERNALRITIPEGKDFAVVQIAGLVARRILTFVKEGEPITGGARFGLIRFGSRTDLYLPEGVVPMVMEGQRMLGGETVIADMRSTEPARTGSIL